MACQPDEKPKHRRRGIYLLPNLFTTATLFGGFYAILAAMDGRFEAAAIAIFVAMMADTLDGRIARMTNTQTDFGAEYDSLADMVAFGLAPALVIYLWALNELGKFGWLVAFIYTAGTALRLARFNTQVGIADKRYFQGLASPSAAAIIAGAVWVGVEHDIASTDVVWVAAIITLFSGLLMVSNIRYSSFKGIDFRGKIPFIVLVAVMWGFAIILWQPPLVLFLMFLGYAASGPILTLTQLRQHRAERLSGTGERSDDE